MSTPTRKPIMTLYSGYDDPYSHASRIVLFEKDVDCHIEYLNQSEAPEVLADLNPYFETPTLIDRELVLYSSTLINEYLDERLPHPPLMPVDPVNRARARLMVRRVYRDWTRLLPVCTGTNAKKATEARQIIRDGLTALSPVFSSQTYLLGEEYSLVDCYMAALLWRLPNAGIELPKQAKPVMQYAQRLFSRPAFNDSLSEIERGLRDKKSA
jgi:RNA polymerase-associated protein